MPNRNNKTQEERRLFIEAKKRAKAEERQWNKEIRQKRRRRDKKAAAETKKREKAEERLWAKEARQEKTRREKVNAADIKKRAMAEERAWAKEIWLEQILREKQRDVDEAKGWKGSKKFGQIRRRFRRKFEKLGRRRPPSFDIVKTYSNANAKFTTYFDAYKVNVYGRVDPVVVLKKAIDMTVDARGLRPGDKIRLIVSHQSWTKLFSTKLATITTDEHFFYNLIKAIIKFVEYKSIPLNDVTIEVQSTKIPRGTDRLKITKHNIGCKKKVICIKNDDTTCLARVIVTAVANNNKAIWTKSQIKNGFNDSRKLQEIEALKLHGAADVEIFDFKNTLEDVDTIAKHLGIQINIVDVDYFNEIIHSTGNGDMIYLICTKTRIITT